MGRLDSLQTLFGPQSMIVVEPPENYTGATMLFVQAAAPTGWTRETTHDDCALRCVTGSSLGDGGSVAFSSVYSNQNFNATTTYTGVTGSRTLTSDNLPSHNHGAVPDLDNTNPSFSNMSPSPGSSIYVRARTFYPVKYYGNIPTMGDAYSPSTHSGTGSSTPWGGGSHQHDVNVTASGTGSFDLRVQYVDAILATKD